MSFGPKAAWISIFTWLVCSLTAAAQPPNANEPFLWGVGNSAFQVEGSPRDSDWLAWTRQPGRIKDGTRADVATDFWHRYDEDFALAQGIGLNAFRISIAWERVEPSEGNYDLDALEHYERMLVAMRARGLEPVVTLNHTVLPLWLAQKGGLLAPNYVERFAQLAQVVIKALAAPPASVRWWLTLNEPEVQVLQSYTAGLWPPGKKDFKAADSAMRNLARAHLAAVRKIRALGFPDLRIGIAKNWQVLQPKRNGHAFDRWATSAANQQYNFRFLDEVKRAPDPGLDFIGINYYSRNLIRAVLLPPFMDRTWGPGPKTDLGWEIYPEGLSEALRTAWRRWKLPILVTENGLADSEDALRVEFLDRHLEQLDQARKAGVPVLGYLHWSLTDNFEWAEGLGSRFGLVAIDYSTAARTPRPSYFHYGEQVRRRKDGRP